MKTKISKIIKLSLALCMILGLFSGILNIQLYAKEELVNVALSESAKVYVDKEDSSWGGLAAHLNDGKDNTYWSYPASDEWPVTARLNLGGSKDISEVVIKLNGGDVPGRAVDVTIQYAQNGILTELIPFGSLQQQAMGSDVKIAVDVPKAATDVFVTLSNPTTDGVNGGTFWPSIREFEVYEKQDVKLSKYNNIASQSVITTDGNEHATDGSAKLVDKDDATLYKFHKDQLTSEKFINLHFDEARTMDAFRIAFEHVNDEPYAYQFVYSILAKNGDGEYTTLVDHESANRTDKWQQEYKINEATYTDVKIVMHSCTNVVDGNQGIGWPAIAEFEVYGSEVAIDDASSIAFNKPVHASSNRVQATNVNDGSKKTAWSGVYYPGYVDIDLEKNYNLDTIEVYTPAKGYSQYSIYTSMNGRDFDKLAEKTSKDSANEETGEIYQADKKEARIIRIYMEYNSAATAAIINEVRATGTESGTAIESLPEINTTSYEDSKYNVSVNEQDTYDEVNGIIERRLGKQYQSWFSLQLADNPNQTGYDYFALSSQNGKINIKGNDGVSLAMGLNHYLKYYCNVNISQVGDQVSMPASMVNLDSSVFKETKVETRYSYNYCTLSYSMAFWGEEEWRNELDWLALNGVNVVLDATAQEEVWRRFLGKIGYDHEDIKDFIAGPAYYAWAYMANLSGFGGPVHDSWFEERTELARKNQLIMRKLGMQPALQGYSGMVPTDILEHDKDAKIITQGTWCSFQRPSMLETTSDTFDKYADLFYLAQNEVYGDVSDYYATDPFHEGGNTGGMSSKAIAQEVMGSMLKADANGIWIIQSWQGNPTSELLAGLEGNREHALVLDLYAEKTPHYNEGNPNNGSYGYSKEFDGTPWVFCMLNNFGGRLGLHGHLDNLANNIPTALNSSEHMAGIGIAPEASVNNPVLYDFLFETIWQDDATKNLEAVNIDEWLDDYATRRYGAESESAKAAWSILKDTVYNSDLNNLGQGAPESVVNARPALNISAASTWGNAVISYDKVKLEEAASLLLKDYDKLKDSEGYLYDVATVLQQVLSNSAQEYQKKMSAAYNAKDLAAFTENAKVFMSIIDDMEKVTSTNEYYLLGRWVEQAKSLAANADDFTKDLYEFNAKALITTWGSYNQAETGGLKDYSNRQWSGLINDYYKVRWERWISARTNELSGKEYESNINWFEWEWAWARSNTEYTTQPTKLDLSKLGATILESYTVTNPDADDSNDIDVTKMNVTAENFQPGEEGEGNPKYVLDGKNDTIWHTRWEDTARDTHYLIFTLDETTNIDGMRFLQRQTGSNGVVTKFKLLIRENENEEWTEIISDGNLSTDTAWQKISFDEVKAKQIKLQVTDSTVGDGNKYAAAAEIRFTSEKKDTSLADLNDKITEVKAIDSSLYTKVSYDKLANVITEAEKLVKDEKASEKDRREMIEKINKSVTDLIKRADTTALKTLIDEIKAIDADKYTSESYTLLINKADEATAAMINGLSEAEVNEYITTLNTLKKGLVEADKVIEIKDKATNIVVKGELPEGVKLSVEILDNEALKAMIKDKNYLNEYTIEKAFNIRLYLNDELYTPKKPITITFDLTNELLAKTLGSVYIDEDGKVEILASYIDTENKTMTISVNRLSDYAIHSKNTSITTGDPTTTGSGSGANTGDTTNTGLWIYLLLGAGALMLMRKKAR